MTKDSEETWNTFMENGMMKAYNRVPLNWPFSDMIEMSKFPS